MGVKAYNDELSITVDIAHGLPILMSLLRVLSADGNEVANVGTEEDEVIVRSFSLKNERRSMAMLWRHTFAGGLGLLHPVRPARVDFIFERVVVRVVTMLLVHSTSTPIANNSHLVKRHPCSSECDTPFVVELAKDLLEEAEMATSANVSKASVAESCAESSDQGKCAEQVALRAMFACIVVLAERAVYAHYMTLAIVLSAVFRLPLKARDSVLRTLEDAPPL